MSLAVNPTLVLISARAWIGTPTVRGTSRRGAGCDCVGLVTGVIRDVTGRDIGRGAIPASGVARTEALLRAAREYLIEPHAAPTAGDVIAWSTGGAVHLGISTGQGAIHACDRTGRVVEVPGAIGRTVLRCWQIPAVVDADPSLVTSAEEILAVVDGGGGVVLQSALDASLLGRAQFAGVAAALDYLDAWGVDIEVI